MNGVTYQKLSVVGKGGTSQVFQVLSPDGKIRALKRVSLKDEASGRLDRNLLECVSNEVTLMLALRSAGMTGPSAASSRWWTRRRTRRGRSPRF